jgi:hypothetical protein
MEQVIYKTGRNPVKLDRYGRTLDLKDFMGAVPDPPTAVVNSKRVYDALGINDPTILFPLLGNDKVGDCTIAAIGHMKTVYSGLVGIKTIPTTEDTLTEYYKITHGLDTGCNELDVLKKLKKTGILGEKAPVYGSIDVKNHKEVQQVIWLFGGIYIGFNVQANAQQDFFNRVPWTPGKLTNDGHAVDIIDYSPTMMNSLTWGNDQQATWDWWDCCVDEAWLILPQEYQMPNFLLGFEKQQLLAAAQALAQIKTKKCFFFFNC